MGEAYYKEWLEEEGLNNYESLRKFVQEHGLHGLLSEFEVWLTIKKNLKVNSTSPKHDINDIESGWNGRTGQASSQGVKAPPRPS